MKELYDPGYDQRKNDAKDVLERSSSMCSTLVEQMPHQKYSAQNTL